MGHMNQSIQVLHLSKTHNNKEYEPFPEPMQPRATFQKAVNPEDPTGHI